MRASTLEVTIRSTSGFVRQSCVLPFMRLPFTMLKYSGCWSKYWSGGRSLLNVWQLPSPPPKRNGVPPYFSSFPRHDRLFTRKRAAKAPFCSTSHQNGSRIMRAGTCASSSVSGTAKRSMHGTFSHQLAYQRQPAKRSRSS